jgi:hypothetical protein
LKPLSGSHHPDGDIVTLIIIAIIIIVIIIIIIVTITPHSRRVPAYWGAGT